MSDLKVDHDNTVNLICAVWHRVGGVHGACDCAESPFIIDACVTSSEIAACKGGLQGDVWHRSQYFPYLEQSRWSTLKCVCVYMLQETVSQRMCKEFDGVETVQQLMELVKEGAACCLTCSIRL